MLSREPEKLELGPEDSRRIYWLKRPVLHERANWRRAVAACGGKFNGTQALLDLLADGVRHVMDGHPVEIVDAVIAKVERQREAVKAWAEKSDDKDLAKAVASGVRDLVTIESEVIARFAPYATAVGDDAAYWAIAGIEAARAFLVKWEGIDFELKRTRAGVDDSCLEQIPENDFAFIGMFADRLSRLRDAERKKSNSPPLSSPGGETSNSLNAAMNGQFPNSESPPKNAPSPN